jgi:NAD(P)-dependent dehydrogenase (short-subunit alcohol dehydrogenase family)
MRSLFKPVTANNSGISANIFAVISQAATPRWQGFCGKAFSTRCFSSANNSDINEDCAGAVDGCHVTEAIGGLKGSRGRSAYSASKHAVIGLTRSAALDYAAKGIRISAVCPGMVNTPMAGFVSTNYDPEIVSRMVAQEPIGRFGEPEEIAAGRDMALQPGRELHSGSCNDGRWRPPRRLIEGAKIKILRHG